MPKVAAHTLIMAKSKQTRLEKEGDKRSKILLEKILARNKRTAVEKKNRPERKVVHAVKVRGGFATCSQCGQKIKLELDGPVLRPPGSGVEYLPVLIGVICPHCKAEVRLDHPQTKISAAMRKATRGRPTSRKISRRRPQKKRAH